jgi:hypothetical protein
MRKYIDKKIKKINIFVLKIRPKTIKQFILNIQNKILDQTESDEGIFDNDNDNYLVEETRIYEI